MPTPYNTTVASAAASRDLTTLATVKQELGVTTSTSDEILGRFITEQSVFAATYCGRQFTQETLVDLFRLHCADYNALILSRAPIVSITSIVENSATLAVGEYEFDADTGEVWRLNGSDQRMAWAAGKVTVTFVGGYQLLATLPYDVERGVIELVKELYYAKTRDPMVRAEAVEGIGRTEFWVGSVPGGGTISAAAARYLDPYRKSLVL